MAPLCYFVRHGQTGWNAELRLQGQADVPMNETGRAQAKRNGEALRGLLPGIAKADFVASPLARARETMRIVRSALDLDPDDFLIDERLMEAHYGDWQGTLLADLPGIDAEGIEARLRDPFRWRPQGGESYEDLFARVAGWAASAADPCVVVSHGGVSRCLRAHALGLPPEQIPTLESPQDRVLVLSKGTMRWL